MAGWIKLHRQIIDNPLWLSEPFTRAQAWVDMILLANHKSGFVRVRGNCVTLKRGDLGWSQPKLAIRWGWSRGKVCRFLDELETEQQIVQQKSRITSVITIVKYDEYQGNGTTDNTTYGQQTIQQTDPNKNVKKEKKNKEVFSVNSDPYKIAHQLHENILSLGLTIKQPDLQSWAKHVDYMIRIDKIPAADILRGLVWIQADPAINGWPGWGSVILSTRKLREKWTSIQTRMHTGKKSAAETFDFSKLEKPPLPKGTYR